MVLVVSSRAVVLAEALVELAQVPLVALTVAVAQTSQLRAAAEAAFPETVVILEVRGLPLVD